MRSSEKIITEFMSLADPVQALNLSRFFKTGKGEYGEGDKFLGIKVPITRTLVKKYRQKVDLKDINALISSEWHEIRLAGFLLLIELYNQSLKKLQTQTAEEIISFYINNIDKGNNWDLVDLVAPKLLGDWLTRNPQKQSILLEFSGKEGSLWHQRVAIVATFALIRVNDFKLTFEIAEKYLNHSHDLIHKATGWMLREIGKRSGKKELTEFLNNHKSVMPRTMLRYAIERFPAHERAFFMQK